MSDRETLDLDAAEYVLGTLSGAERRGFEQGLTHDPAVRAAVRDWEARLAPLADRVAPVTPDPAVWAALEQRIGQNRVQVLRPATSPWLKTWASVATAASVALAALLVLQPKPEPIIEVRTVEKPAVRTVYVAYLKMPDVDMHWTVSAAPESGQIRVVAGGTPPDGASGKSPELWWIGEQGPVSLGVIPVRGEQGTTIPTQVAGFEGHQLAVSLEPSGGSPTGLPTGPVIAVAPAVRAF